MKPCPYCAEMVQDAARLCRHCQRDIAAPPRQSLLDQPGRYDVPLRFETQQHTYGGAPGGGGVRVGSAGIALKGHVCPQCHGTDYVSKYSVWHGVLAICFFPIGLLGFLLPVHQCVHCQAEYGAGKELTKVLGIMALLLIGLVVLILIAAAASS